MRSLYICILVIVSLFPRISGSPSPPQKQLGPTTGEIKRTGHDVNEKLKQLHKVIDALQMTLKHMSDGHDKEARVNAEKMKTKFQKLTAVISKLTTQNNNLHHQNKRLRLEKNALVDKISKLEIDLEHQAEAAQNVGAEAWLRNTAQDLKQFLEESGLEHFASPRFSPLIAGIVSNGVIILPLAMTSFFLLHYMKQMTVLRIVMALNLFDFGFAVAVIVSSALLLGDPFEGMRHISEVNFVFIQLVVGGVFWLTCGFLVAAAIQNRKNKASRYAVLELALRILIAADYTRRIWVPVMERDDLPIALPYLFYVLYLTASVITVKLTAMANWHSVAAYRPLSRQEENSAVMVSVVTQHTD